MNGLNGPWPAGGREAAGQGPPGGAAPAGWVSIGSVTAKLPSLVRDEALAVVAVAPAAEGWSDTSREARQAASHLADLFTEDELLEGLRLLQAPSGDAASGAALRPALLATELAIVLARSNLRVSDATGSSLRLSS